MAAVKQIMSKNLVTVGMDDTLNEVKKIFDRARFHHLLVVSDEKLVGVVSDRDLLKFMSHKVGHVDETSKDLATLNRKVHQIMSRKLIVLPPDAEIFAAIDIFTTHSISCIPIVDENNKPVGILSWRDILKMLKRRYEVNQLLKTEG